MEVENIKNFEDISEALTTAREEVIIKIMGVGGGGGNAVNYMYTQGIKDVSFLICNTDRQALNASPVPAKLQLGPGLGAGGLPEKARELAEANRDIIRDALSDGTRMLFITAGMGGGTGTGASPIVAEVAQELDILTVAVVTLPYKFEGIPKIEQALRGAASLAKAVDAILVIQNENLVQIYPDLTMVDAFKKSDDAICSVAKSIAEIITVPGYINTDFNDVYQVLHKGGIAILGVGYSQGEENRITDAFANALQSPFSNTDSINGSQRILFQIYSSQEHGIRMNEKEQINQFIESVGMGVMTKWGMTIDDTLDKQVKITLISAGYETNELTLIDDNDDYQHLAYLIKKYYGINIKKTRPSRDESKNAAHAQSTLQDLTTIDLNGDSPKNQADSTMQPLTIEVKNIDDGGITIIEDESSESSQDTYQPWIQ